MCFQKTCIPGVLKGERTEGKGTYKCEALLPTIGVGHFYFFWDTSRHLSSASWRTVQAEKVYFPFLANCWNIPHQRNHFP